MAGRYAIIVPITTAYMQEGEVLLKSLCINNPEIPVHVISKDGQAESLYKYSVVKKVYNEPLTETVNAEFRQIRTSRFRLAAELKNDYDVVALFDADMVNFLPLKTIFSMAEKGAILVGCDSTIYRYNYQSFNEMGIDAPKNIDRVHCSFCTVPLFINPSLYHDFLNAVYISPTGNDLSVPNLLSITMGLTEKLYYLPSENWLNIHHSMLKSNLHCIKTNQGLFSKTGQPIYMLHGHWGQEVYVKELISPMEKNYGYYPPYIDCAKECIKTLKEEYDKYAKL